MAIMIYIDSLYYGGDEWTITSLNFLKVNVVESLSKYFGEDPWFWYVGVMGPAIFTIVYPFLLYANTVGHCCQAWSKGQVPYLTYFTAFYVIVFSLIPHKENRFLLPILPFALLTTAEHFSRQIKNHSFFYNLVLKVYIFV